ncbi:MAG: InlB B-repeat-containing protein [Clostridiales bacterium]|nr:InlB B-repeat-containing protein [Clostridiales bacterium]
MKKTKLLILALAAFSSVAIAAVGCGDDTGNNNPPAHTNHTYTTWQSDDDGHWQKCDECENKTDSTAHVDVVIKETKADGEDGYCDVCDRLLKKTVTFNLNGHGETAPAAQKVEYGKKAQAPADLTDGDYFVTGWYTDAACSADKKFDFDTAVTADITLYAKWEDDPTPGASAKYAYELKKGVQNLQVIGEGGKLYYKFTAEAEGRYTISLGSGNSAKCNFATDKDEEVYGNGSAAAVKNLDLEKDEVVVIVVTCKEQLGADAKVTALVNDCTNEDLPKDKYPAGEYTDGSVTIEINRENKTVKLGENENGYPYTYVGGKTDTLVFTGLGNTVYRLKYNVEDGRYYLTYKSSNGGADTTNKLVYQEPQAPIAVAKFSGKYEPKGDAGDRITEIVIYESGNGKFIQNTYNYDWELGSSGASYVQKTNTLCFAQYFITVNIDDNGNVTGITVSGGGIESAVVYTRVGDSGVELPKNLLVDNGDYTGSIYTVTKNAYSSAIGDNRIEITDYDGAKKLYTVTVNDNFAQKVYKYKIEVVNETTLKLYNDKDELVDTLEKYVPVYNELPEGEDEIATATVKKNMHLYKAAQAGWYKVEWDDETLKVYYNLNANDPTNPENGVEVSSGDSVYLAKDAILGLYLGWYGDLPEKVAVTISATTAPVGRTEDNPVALENGSATINNIDNTGLYYFSYTAPAAGAYLVNVSYSTNWGTTSCMVHYTIKGEHYGYDNTEGSWRGGLSNADPYAKITLEANEEILIVADRKGAFGTAEALTALIFEDYSATATEIDVATNATGALENGIYKADLSAAKNTLAVKLTSEQDITVTVLGNATTGKAITLNADMLARGFKLACEGAVNYSVVSSTVYSGECKIRGFFGEETTPVILNLADDYSMAIYTVGYEAYGVTLQKVGNNYKFSYGEGPNEVTLTVKDGAVEIDDEFIGKGTLNLPAEEPEDAIKYSCDELVLIFEKELADMADGESINGTYEDSVGPADITITKSGNSYSYTGPDGISGTITLGDGSIDVDDNYCGQLTLNKQASAPVAAEGTEDNPKVVEFTDGAATVTLPEYEEYYIQLPAGKYNISNDGSFDSIAIVHSDDSYDMVNTMTPTISITVSAGDLVSLMHLWGATVTITQVAE